jgi:hypothetical protein
MKTIIAVMLFVCAPVVTCAQQPTPEPSPSPVRSIRRHRRPITRALADPIAPAPQPATDYLIGAAKVDITKDETVIRLAMAQHGSVLIELPASDGPRYIIPGDPEMATVDEKALERNKRAIVVRPGSLFVPPLPNRKARTPAATVTAQMRSGLVVTFLFYPVEDLAQNVHRCVLTYNRDEVVARRRAAGLPVNLDTVNNSNEERRVDTGQSAAPISISVETNDEQKSDTKSSDSPGLNEKKSVASSPGLTSSPAPNAAPVSASTTKVETKSVEDQQIEAATREALAAAIKKPKQFKNWTRPSHDLALSVLRPREEKEFQIVVVAVKNTGRDNVTLLSSGPDLLIEMLGDNGTPVNLQSLKTLRTELSISTDAIPPGTIAYYAIAYAAPVLGAHQQIKVTVAQTNAADEPASIALSKSSR